MPKNGPQSRKTVTIALLAKRPAPGRVKTRLIGDLSPIAAARVHQAMLECLLARLTRLPESTANLVLALDQPAAQPTPNVPNPTPIAIPDRWRIIDQGSGDLGHRLRHVWQSFTANNPLPSFTPIIFLGSDSPDLPLHALTRAIDCITNAPAPRAAIGPTPDGGYWTLAASHYLPTLTENIDWGTHSVYHQTCQALGAVPCDWTKLDEWPDVDNPHDLHNLQARLVLARDLNLQTLRKRLADIAKESNS